MLFVWGMQYFMRQYFFNFIEKIEHERIYSVTQHLSTVYQSKSNWEFLRGNQIAWHHLLRPIKPPAQSHSRPPPPPRWNHPPPPDHRPPPPRWNRPPPPDHRPPRPPPGSPQPPPMKLMEEIYNDSPPTSQPHRPPPPLDPIKIIPRLALFDENKNWIIGRQADPSRFHLHPIIVDEKIVGWIGLQPIETFSKPQGIEFIKYQTRGIYAGGIGILLFSLIITWFLARHLIKPLKKLTTGTQALAARRFTTRVNIKTQDEFQQLATNFNEMAKTLQKYEQMRQQWLADIAHELRTPLAILRGEIEALQDGVREINAETLESLHSEVLHLTRLVEDLRTLSLADSESLVLHRQPINPLKVLQHSLNQFEAHLKQQNLTLYTALQTQESPYLAGDTDRLMQVFNNLLENGLRYIDKPGWLKIQAHLTASRLELNFTDSGPGVPYFALPHLFNRLYRVEQSRNRVRGGSGLGLAICKSIIEAHGGHITADHASSGGLWIKISLPFFLEK